MRDGILLLENVDDGSPFTLRVGQLAELVGEHLSGGPKGLGKDRQAELLADLHDRLGKIEEAVGKYNRSEDVAPLVELHYKRTAAAAQTRIKALEDAVLGLAAHSLKQSKYLKWLALVFLAGSLVDLALFAHMWR